MTRVALSVILAVAILNGCGGEGGSAAALDAETDTTTLSATTAAPREPETPQQFVIRVNEYMLKGQFGRAWEALHPEQQQIVSRSVLADCFGSLPWPKDAEFEVTESYDEPWPIPPGKTDHASKALTVQVKQRFSDEGAAEEMEAVFDTFTQHAFRVGPGWRWIVSPQVFENVQSNSC